MRDGFSGFYGISEDTIGDVLKSEDTVFIFDTNIFLTLYRCEEETRNQFFDIWKKVKDKCWFPHHVCLEYQRNRLNAVKGSRDSLSAIPKKMSSYIDELKKEMNDNNFSKTISRYSNLRGEINELLEKIYNHIDLFKQNSIDLRNGKIDFFSKHDVIRDEIDNLTEGKIGPAPSAQAVIDELNKAGKIRYKYKTGPGYEDSADKKNEFYSFNGINYDAEYGDYYVWSQIIEYVKENHGKNVIYVTNDAKSDFFYKLDGKTRGPNESLTSEIKKNGAKEFLLQNIDTFLHHANKHLNAKIEETTINELSNASSINSEYRITDKNDPNRSFVETIISQQFGLSNLDDGKYEKYIRLKDRLIRNVERRSALDTLSLESLTFSEMENLELEKRNLANENTFLRKMLFVTEKSILKSKTDDLNEQKDRDLDEE